MSWRFDKYAEERLADLKAGRTSLLGMTTGPRPIVPVLPSIPAPAQIAPPLTLVRRVAAARSVDREIVDLAPPNPSARKPNFEALKAETPKGCCIGCDEPLPPNSAHNRLLCGAPECTELYRAIWHRDRSTTVRCTGATS